VAVHDICVKDNDLVLGTMGRSIWVLDDLTPIREWAPAVKSKLHLFAPPAATRWRTFEVPAADFSKSTGDNPPYGAAITVNLPAKAKEVTLEVLGPDGKQVAKLTSEEKKKEAQEDLGSYSGREEKKKPLPKDAGLHRVAWDLRHEGAKKIVG